MLFLHQLLRLVDVHDVEGHQVLDTRQRVEELLLGVLGLEHEVLELLVDLGLVHHWSR